MHDNMGMLSELVAESYRESHKDKAASFQSF